MTDKEQMGAVEQWVLAQTWIMFNDLLAFARAHDAEDARLREAIEDCGICGDSWDIHERYDTGLYCPRSPQDRAVYGDTHYCAKSTWDAVQEADKALGALRRVAYWFSQPARLPDEETIRAVLNALDAVSVKVDEGVEA